MRTEGGGGDKKSTLRLTDVLEGGVLQGHLSPRAESFLGTNRGKDNGNLFVDVITKERGCSTGLQGVF